MQITVHRAPERLKGTYWRPVEHTLQQREVIEAVRREVPGDKPDKRIQRSRDIDLGTIDLLLAGMRRPYTEARIEDVYKQGRFVEGFVYVRALAAFVHEDEVGRYEKRTDQIGPGAIIAKAVRIEYGATIGAYAEFEQGARVLHGATIGPHAIVRKGAWVMEGAVVGPHTYLGQFGRVGPGATVGSMGIMERGVRIGPGAQLGRQNHLGLAMHVGANAWLDDSVRLGRMGYTGPNTQIGEMTTAGNYLHVGEGSIIGAESRFGASVRVARNVILRSPTYAADHELIAQSNLFTSKPLEP